MLATVFTLQAQDIIIKGKITDAKTKKPLPYVLLRVAGSMSGSQTNLDGEYCLKLSKEQSDKK
ncbi:MAG: carboxypeptidase-like regulatory domain-containing protein [Bacteroidales bacterium]|nr:carboxypeptidase-like regulatory domain-containing protein [Bacteroidales bacterium]